MRATVERVEGVDSAELNFAGGTLLVEHSPAVDPRAAVESAVRQTGHGIVPLDREPAGAEPVAPWTVRYRTEVATAGAGLFSLLGAGLQLAGAPQQAVVTSFAIAILFGGSLVWRRALVSLKARMLDMNVLMSIAVFGAAALGEWGEGATVFFLYALGGLLESRSLERTRRSIRELMDLAPPVAHVITADGPLDLASDRVLVGDVVAVRPGERVPLDGTVRRGTSAVDEAPITGESVPVDKREGDQVYAGSLNTSGLLEITVTAPAADSTLARVVYLVEEAQASRAPSQTFVDRFSRVYTPTVVGLAAAIAVVPPLLDTLTGLALGGFEIWVNRALVMLVVACPCALVLSTPVSIVSAITRASRDGVLVKGGAFLETAAQVRAVAFDKTGTLTVGRPELAEVIALRGSAADVLARAAALEAHSAHPLARAIVRAADGSVHPGAVEDLSEEAGRGVRGRLDGVDVAVVSPPVAEELGAMTPEAGAAVDEQESLGRTALVLVEEGRAAAVFAVADRMRADARQTVEALFELGVEHVVMLTGDNERVGEAVAQRAGLSSYLSRLLPSAKTDAVRVLQQRYGRVAMVGDGVNDAPALAAADIGIAMGAAGSDTALETADVALMRDDLTALPSFFDLGRRTVSIIRQNVVVSIGVKAVVLVLALFGMASLWLAVFADTGISLLVTLNGMRLLRSRPRRPRTPDSKGSRDGRS